MSVKLIIYDLDGTLIDSSGDITNAINYAIAPYGVPLITVGETISMVGEGVSRLMERVIAKEGLSADKDFLVDRFVEYYSAHIIDTTTIYPGVKETLEKLNRYKKAVISNKRETLSIRILEKLDLAKFFDVIVGSDSTPERKPSPVPVQYVLSRFGVKPDEAVIVGDSNYDIDAGKAAGIRTIAVTYGYRTLDFLRGADFIIKSMPELVPIVEKLQ